MRKQFNLKRTLFLLSLILLTSLSSQLNAQVAGSGIFFQAVARDGFSNPAKDRNIIVETSLIQSNANGAVILTERFNATTDASGVFTLSIGEGTKIGGTVANFKGIDWSKGPFFLNVKIAIAPIVNPTNWDYTKDLVDLGTSPFGSVPYALFAESVAGFDTKLNVADTAKMLLPYARIANLSSLLTNKLNVADSLTKYVTPTQLAAKTFDSTSIYNQLATKATISNVNSTLNTKLNIADSIVKYVTPAQLAAKTFDSTAIYNQLALKANIADVNTALALKANTTDVNTSLALKANTANVTSSLATKLNISDSTTQYITPTQLALKANTVDVSNTLNTKENLSNKSINVTTDAASDTKYPSVKAIKTYVDSQITISSIPDADGNTKGKIQIAGDLTGSASAPVIANNAITNAKIATGIDAAKISGDIAGKASNITGNLAIANGGTGATSAAGARTNLGLVIGTDVQAPLSFTAPLVKNGNSVTINQATASVDGYISASDYNSFTNKIDATQKAANNGVATLGNDGKIPSNQIPSISFQSAVVVNSQSAMLALSSAVVGSIAIRTDLSKNFVLSALPSSTLANWIELATPSSVTSVNGSTGPNVVLTTNDITEGSNNKFYTDARVRGALSAVSPLSFNTSSGIFSLGVASASSNGYLSSTDFSTFNNKQNAITAGVDYLAPNGSASLLTNFPTLNQNTTGNAATASKFAAARNINGVPFDGSADITITANASTLTGSNLPTTVTSSSLSGVGTITSGVWSGTTIALAKGGTGATTAAAALTNLGAEAIANKSNDIATDAASTTKYPSVKSIKDYVDQQSANAGVADNSITSAKISGTIAIGKGGTGATTAADARTNLGLVIGTNVMAANATTTLTGDVSGSGNGSFAATVNSVGGVSSSTISTLPTTVASHTTSITANTASINTLNTNVSANTASITANTASINTLNTNVSANTASITANTTSINTLNTNVSANTTSITANTNSIATLNTNVSANTASITANTASINTLNTNVSANTASVTANTASINTLNTNVSSNTSSITTINTSLATKAPLASPSFTGVPTAPTPATSDNSTTVATTAYVKASITAANAGVSSVGAIAGTSTAEGATISGTTQLILTPADATNGGIVTNGTQTFAGAKTFNNDIIVNGLISVGRGPTNISSNTALGNSVLRSNNGVENVAIGFWTLGGAATQRNTAVGYQAKKNNSGDNNVAIGHQALYTNSGSNNTVVGYEALNTIASSSGSNNVVVGDNSGSQYGNVPSSYITSISQSVLLGSGVNTKAAISSNEIAIGYNVIGNGSNTVTIGNYSNTANYFRGDLNLTGNVNGGTWSGTTIGSNYGGAGTVNGLMKANGSGVVSAAVAGTDYVAPSGNVATATALATGRTISTTGDITYTSGSFDGTGNVTGVATLAASGVASGTYGSSTAIPVLTVDTKGRVTGASTVGIIAGVNSLNYTSTTSYASGGTISGTSLTLAAASATNPGLISTGAQTIAGAKTFSSDVTATNFLGNATTATTAGNITATSNTTLTSLANLATVGTITSGIWSATSIAIANGGTGAITAADARTNLGAEAISNKSIATDLGGTGTSDVLYPSQKAVKNYVDTRVASAGVADGSITNVKLANSTTTLGSTTLTLGGTVTSVTGLSSLAATNLTGTLSGTATSLAVGRTISTTGDITYTSGSFDGTGNVTGVATLAASGVSSGTYGSSTAIPVLTVDTKGRVTSASTVGIIAGVNSLNYTSTTSYAAGGTISGTSLTLAAADATNPGLISTGAQTIVGAKTFSNTTTFNKDISINGITAGLGVGQLSSNTVFGNGSLAANTTGYSNAAFGAASLGLNTTGFYNTAIGKDAMHNNTTGTENTGIGLSALYSTAGGSYNTALGSSALVGNTSASYNVAVGRQALGSSTIGGNNVAIGAGALATNVSGNNNTALGYGADIAANNLNNATAIGNGAIASASNTIQLGNTSVTSVITSGTISATGFTGPLTGNASTATKLAATKNINGVAFDGSSDITIAANANTLTGTTLASNVVSSSLTSVGTITSGTWNGAVITPAYGGTGLTSLGTGIATFLATPTSANLNTAVTDETGSGSLVFATSPTLVTPVLGAATGTSLSLTGNLSASAGTFSSTLTAGASTLASASITGNETVSGTLGVTGTTTLSTITASGNATLTTVNAGATTLASASITGNTTIGGTLGITGATTLSSTSAHSGAATFSSTVNITGATSLSTLTASGNATLTTVNAGATTLASAAITGNTTIGGTLGVTGATTLSSTLTAGTSTLTSLSVTNNETVGGTLGVTGATSLSSTLGVTGATSLAALTTTGAATISNTTNATSTSTGALIVKGGVGIANDVKIGGTIEIDGGTPGAGKVLTSDAGGLASWSNAIGSTVVTSTTTYAITLAEAYVFYTGTAAGAFTIPDPSASNAGKAITIKNKTAFAITITPTTAGKIYIDNANAAVNSVSIGIEASNNWIKLVSDGTQWNVIRALF